MIIIIIIIVIVLVDSISGSIACIDGDASSCCWIIIFSESDLSPNHL